jgi:hypothetical protein
LRNCGEICQLLGTKEAVPEIMDLKKEVAGKTRSYFQMAELVPGTGIVIVYT